MKANGMRRSLVLKQIEVRKEKHDKLLLAFEKAHEVRKFEIDLYWRRTAYFWAIIAAIFAGFFLMASKSDGNISRQQELYLGIIAIIGFVFSYAWFLVNKGSKFWQENWEYHIDTLEDEITGPLYKTVYYRKGVQNKDKDKTLKEHILSPSSISVSKVNQSVALTTMVTWVVLLLSIVEKQGVIMTIIYSALLVFISKKMHDHCKSEFYNNKNATMIESHVRETKLEK